MTSTLVSGLDRKLAETPNHLREMLIELTARRIEYPRATGEAGKEPCQ